MTRRLGNVFANLGHLIASESANVLGSLEKNYRTLHLASLHLSCLVRLARLTPALRHFQQAVLARLTPALRHFQQAVLALP